MKVIFLDIDGVVNSKETLSHSHKGVMGIDPYLSLLVHRIIEATDAKLVLSSSWKHGLLDEVKKVFPIIDTTPNNKFSRIRGFEIDMWLEDHPEVTKYAILDDDDDMLPEQMPNFFHTSFETGLTEEIANAVVKHLNA